ncbi:bifunctional diguanylate cyclase/phosphodiesterase [Lutibaculum baratangense]|uniref:Diguanylate cyclase/phosphodiesterase (GGDEF & EAL domains) with PAS/PAC sensor(S) n=1 Tax=Lutibaculum baratangense AMV1 TaxID=631454 RepID=V4RD11_9HYPH|nr:bifunctional diguanylate cyclase/phosphodiesterase [Lutibaculum baratangense]ESR24036.1 diguanylate cyclase/phosphodiesterase (GGDEF & EAL domains) with PAS/PAC sensor(s) [Lutibaculum baratangense AMV1]
MHQGADAADRPEPPTRTGGTLDILDSVQCAVYHWNVASDELRWSANAARLFRIPSIEAIDSGRRFVRLLDPSGPPGRYDVVMQSGARDPGPGVPYQVVYRMAGGDRDPGPIIEDFGRWFAGPDGRPAVAQGIVRVVPAAGDAVASSEYDLHTGALMRRRFLELVAASIEAAQRVRVSCALAVVAVDHLGMFNDAYGYEAGEDVIAGAAKRIARQVRRGDQMGRLSGNKIGVLLNSCSESDLRIAAARFSDAVASEPIPTRSGSVGATISIGGVVLPRYGRTADEALAHAMQALGEARDHTKGGLCLYEPSPGADVARRRNAEVSAEVIEALNANRLVFALQPIASTGTRAVVHHEVLCRLRMPDGRILNAAEFIESAERLGIIRLIDQRMMDLTLAALGDDPGLSLSLNVSAASVLDVSWFARLACHLRSDRDIARRLMVEVTETVAIEDLDRAADFVRALKDLGCKVAIDDFGAGHTSFRNLRSLGADVVKIDGSFVDTITTSEDTLFFVRTLVALARHLGLGTVAERVTTEEQARILQEAGVEHLQGYLIGKPKLYEMPKDTAVAT